MRMTLIALLTPALCLAQAPGTPRLAVDAQHFNFGKVAPETKPVHRFRLTNSGTGRLAIAKIVASCGCTSVLLGQGLLEPGAGTDLEVAFNTAGLQGKAVKSVQVVSDDPVEPVKTLTFEAEVTPEVVVDTDWVYFQDLVRSDRRKATVKLASGTGQPVEAADVQLSEAPWLGVATRTEGNDLYVDLDFLARRLPPSRLKGTDTVTLHVVNPRPSVVKVRLQWELRPPVTVTPAMVAWAAPAGREQAGTVVLEGRKPFRILAARSSNPLLRLSVPLRKAKARQELRLTLDAGAAAGTYDEKATVTLDTPGHPELEIRVAASLG